MFFPNKSSKCDILCLEDITIEASHQASTQKSCATSGQHTGQCRARISAFSEESGHLILASLVFSIISQDIVNSGVFILSSNFPCTREALGLDLEMQTTLRAAVRYNSCPSIESYSSDKAETYFYAFTFKLLGLPM